MPRPVKVDPGDKGMRSQATGELITPLSSVVNTLVQQGALSTPSTASTTSSPNTLQTTRQISPTRTRQPTVSVQTSSMPAPKPVSISNGGDNSLLGSFWDLMRNDDKAQMSDEEMLRLTSELNAGMGDGDDKPPVAQAAGLMGDTQVSPMQEPQAGDVRIVNDVEQEYHDPSLSGDMGGIDYFSSYSGYTPYNDSYEDYFGDLGMNPELLDELRAPTRIGSAAILHPSSAMGVDDGTMDYDHLTSGFMTGSQYIRYKKELGDLAGNRPIEEIEDSDYAVYDKKEEFDKYGFIPYIPTEDVALSYHLGDVASMPQKGAANLARLRENIGPEVTITMNANDDDVSNDVTFSNSDFERRVNPFFVKWNDIWNNRQDSLLSPPSDTEDYTTWVHEYAVPTDDGDVEYHYGELLDMGPTGGPDGHDDDEFDDNGNYIGTYTLSFSDGTSQTVSSAVADSITNDSGYIELDSSFVTPDEMAYPVSDIEALNTLDHKGLEYDGNIGVYYTPDLVLSDGTRINVWEAQDIYHNDADDVKYNGITSLSDAVPILGKIPIVNMLTDNLSNKPRRLMEQEMIGSGGLVDPSTWNFEDTVNNVADWTLGSIPISSPGLVPWAVSLSQAMPSLAGVNGSSYDPLTGSYRMTSEDPYLGRLDENGRLQTGSSFWNGLATTATPLTEMIAGPIGVDPFWGRMSGGFIDNVLKSPVSKFLANKAAGAVGEGLEEVVGNLFEDYNNYGLNGMFADPIYQTDDDGNVIIDPETGEPRAAFDQASYHELRDESTPLPRRVANFLDLEHGGQDPLNSFLGGAFVDMVLDNLPFFVDRSGVHANMNSLPAGLHNAMRQQQGYRNIKDSGGKVFVPGEYDSVDLGMPRKMER